MMFIDVPRLGPCVIESAHEQLLFAKQSKITQVAVDTFSGTSPWVAQNLLAVHPRLDGLSVTGRASYYFSALRLSVPIALKRPELHLPMFTIATLQLEDLPFDNISFAATGINLTGLRSLTGYHCKHVEGLFDALAKDVPGNNISTLIHLSWYEDPATPVSLTGIGRLVARCALQSLTIHVASGNISLLDTFSIINRSALSLQRLNLIFANPSRPSTYTYMPSQFIHLSSNCRSLRQVHLDFPPDSLGDEHDKVPTQGYVVGFLTLPSLQLFSCREVPSDLVMSDPPPPLQGARQCFAVYRQYLGPNSALHLVAIHEASIYHHYDLGWMSVYVQNAEGSVSQIAISTVSDILPDHIITLPLP